MDPIQHKKWTGVDNRLILKNLKLLAEKEGNINIRIPLIKNVNTSEEEIREMAEFVSALPGGKPVVNLLPYHNIASGKYKKLEIPYDKGEMGEPSEKKIQQVVEMFNSFGLETEVGG
jgi:pyruvate formate lyase activating enzyme